MFCKLVATTTSQSVHDANEETESKLTNVTMESSVALLLPLKTTTRTS